MKIATIETFCLYGSGDQGAYGAPYGFIVKVVSTDGVVGYGETDSLPAVVDAVVKAPFLSEMMSGLAAVLIGANALDTSAAWERMERATLGYGRDGPVRHAMAAIDIALWDLKGKAEGRPVCSLLSGARRDRVRAYASHPLGASLEETARHAQRLVAAGFTAVKFGWHPLGRDAEADEAIVRTLREAVGSKVDLLIDGGLAWDTSTAIARCERFASYNLYWLEEPLAAYDFEGYAALRRASPIRIAAGEMAASRAELTRLVESGGVDVLQVDVSRTGLTEAMRIAAVAERHSIPCVNHTYGYALNAAASLHFVAAIHDTDLFECQATPNEIRDALESAPLRPTDGWLSIPASPGLGVAIDEATLARFSPRHGA
jgi:L-rhamnonate dehydratase